jgi:hypothetical protein
VARRYHHGGCEEINATITTGLNYLTSLHSTLGYCSERATPAYIEMLDYPASGLMIVPIAVPNGSLCHGPPLT